MVGISKGDDRLKVRSAMLKEFESKIAMEVQYYRDNKEAMSLPRQVLCNHDTHECSVTLE